MKLLEPRFKQKTIRRPYKNNAKKEGLFSMLIFTLGANPIK